MHNFLRCIEIAKTEDRIIHISPLTKQRMAQINAFNNNKIPLMCVDKSMFYDYVKRCQPFVFAKMDEGSRAKIAVEEDIHKNTRLELDAPFPVFSIELDTNEYSLMGLTADGERWGDISCIIAIEGEPKKFIYICLINTVLGPTIASTSDVRVNNLVQGFISRMSKEEVGIEHTNVKIKIGHKKAREFHKIRRIVHVRAKSSPPSKSIYGGPIDWTHTWLVRGHWRKITSLGKDREGIYCVQGYTWVTEHEKGQGELIVKTRVIDQSPSDNNILDQ